MTAVGSHSLSEQSVRSDARRAPSSVLVTTSKALVTRSGALVTSSFIVTSSVLVCS